MSGDRHAHGAMHHQHQGFQGDASRWTEVLDAPERDTWQRPGEVIAAASVAGGMVVADIGAGTGYFVAHLSRAVGAGGKVLALDSSPQLVAHMQRRFHEASLSNVEAILVSPEDPGLPAGTLDRILIVDMWHHLSERVLYARKLGQALKATGRLIIVDRAPEALEGPPPQLRLPPEEVLRELRAAGFDASVVPAPLPHQFIVAGEPSRPPSRSRSGGRPW